MVENETPRKKPKICPPLIATFPLSDLPKEVQGWIIELACRLPPLSSSSYSSSSSSFSSSSSSQDGTSHLGGGPALSSLTDPLTSKPIHVDLDSPTTLSLALVSRSFHSQVDQVLYSHIRITRPSALLALQRTLVSRPQLGPIIKSL